MVVNEQAGDAVVLAARNGFWDMGRTDIVRFAALKCVECPAGGSLFEIIMKAITSILKCSETQALEYASHRLVADHNEQVYADHLVGSAPAGGLVVSAGRLSSVLIRVFSCRMSSGSSSTRPCSVVHLGSVLSLSAWQVSGR